MQRRTAKSFLLSFFFISILLHLLFLLSLLFLLHQRPEEQHKQPDNYVPSYLLKGSMTPKESRASKQVVQNQPTPKPQPIQNEPKPKTQTVKNEPPQKMLPVRPEGLKKPVTPPKSMMASSLSYLRQKEFHEMTKPTTEEPILLIGPTHEIPDPFTQLIARALSANFFYPEREGMMGITGRVLIQFTLHPEGYFDEIHIVQSSNSDGLDTAALFAVNKAPEITEASRFLSKPKAFVVGFIFSQR